MFSVREKFPAGMKFFQIPLSWFRAVSAWINNFSAGTGIKFTAPSAPSGNNPVVVAIDEDFLRAKVEEMVRPAGTVSGGEGPTTSHTDMTATNSDGVECNVDADIPFVEGESAAQMSARAATTARTDEWGAGRGADLVRYEVARYQPYFYYQTRYARVFVRQCVYAPSGRLLSVGPEVDSGIVILAYQH